MNIQEVTVIANKIIRTANELTGLFTVMTDNTPITLISGFKGTYTKYDQKFRIVGFQENKHIILEPV